MVRRVLLATVLLAAAAPGHAAEVTVQNDTAGTTTPCDCFIPGEESAAWLTSTCHGDVVAVQVLWRSQFGGAPMVIEDSIILRAGGAFPVPGATLVNQDSSPAIVVAPSLTDGSLNEFRFLDPPSDTKALRVPVTAGQTFVASLKFFNTTSGSPFAPTTVYDADGCQTGKNTAFAIPGGWADACLLGVTGDWVIRAVIDCAEPAPIDTPWTLAPLALAILAAAAVALTAHHRWAEGRSAQSSIPPPTG